MRLKRRSRIRKLRKNPLLQKRSSRVLNLQEEPKKKSLNVESVESLLSVVLLKNCQDLVMKGSQEVERVKTQAAYSVRLKSYLANKLPTSLTYPSFKRPSKIWKAFFWNGKHIRLFLFKCVNELPKIYNS